MKDDFSRRIDELSEDSPIYGLLDDDDLVSHRRSPPKRRVRKVTRKKSPKSSKSGK
jgi:hypothetical protein